MPRRPSHGPHDRNGVGVKLAIFSTVLAFVYAYVTVFVGRHVDTGLAIFSAGLTGMIMMCAIFNWTTVLVEWLDL
jgi:hypothetical protein